MKRILIIGSNGAGKSTFSYKLSEKLNLPLVHIDSLYWRDNWQVTPQDEIERAVLEEAKKPCWIIEGNNLRSLNQRLAYADTVFWFEFSSIRCIFNVLKRELQYRKQARPDMPSGCISQLNFHFLNDVWRFNEKNHSRIQMMLENCENIEVIRFTNYQQIKMYLEEL